MIRWLEQHPRRGEAKRIATRLDVDAVVDRTAKATADRRVTIRPAPDTMVYVTALLPVAQGVGVFAALKRQAEMTFDERSRNQVMADTMVARVTGRPAEQPVSVSLNLVLADTTLVGDDEEPGWCEGYGPVSAAVVRTLVGDAVRHDAAIATLRRLYRHPQSGALVAMESRARRFPKGLVAFIDIRDRTCRTPYCNAPIRHHDRARPHRERGPTSARNGLGECEACNYAKEAPGWVVTTEVIDGVHSAEFRTPTGASYRSTAPPLPGPPVRTRSVMEDRLALDIVRLDAA